LSALVCHWMLAVVVITVGCYHVLKSTGSSGGTLVDGLFRCGTLQMKQTSQTAG